MTKSDQVEKTIDIAFGGTLGSAVGATLGVVGVVLFWKTSFARVLPALGAMMGVLVGGIVAFIDIKLKDREQGTKKARWGIDSNHPFQNSKIPIMNRHDFFGRQALLKRIIQSPSYVWVLLGGRRISKTSILQALKSNFFQSRQAFPVFIDLQTRQPQSTDNFRFIMAEGLEEAIAPWKAKKASWNRSKTNTSGIYSRDR